MPICFGLTKDLTSQHCENKSSSFTNLKLLWLIRSIQSPLAYDPNFLCARYLDIHGHQVNTLWPANLTDTRSSLLRVMWQPLSRQMSIKG